MDNFHYESINLKGNEVKEVSLEKTASAVAGYAGRVYYNTITSRFGFYGTSGEGWLYPDLGGTGAVNQIPVFNSSQRVSGYSDFTFLQGPGIKTLTVRSQSTPLTNLIISNNYSTVDAVNAGSYLGIIEPVQGGFYLSRSNSNRVGNWGASDVPLAKLHVLSTTIYTSGVERVDNSIQIDYVGTKFIFTGTSLTPNYGVFRFSKDGLKIRTTSSQGSAAQSAMNSTAQIAFLDLPPGIATRSQLNLPLGTVATTLVSGNLEHATGTGTSRLYFTNLAGSRKTIAFLDDITSGGGGVSVGGLVNQVQVNNGSGGLGTSTEFLYDLTTGNYQFGSTAGGIIFTKGPHITQIYASNEVQAQFSSGHAIIGLLGGTTVIGGFTFPGADGVLGEVLMTDGAGNLSFGTVNNSPITIQNTTSLFSTGITTYTSTTAANSLLLGIEAGQGVTAQKQVALGYYAGYNATNAYNANFIGVSAGDSATNANKSNFIGHRTGNQATNAYHSNFIGRYTGTLAANANTSNFIGHYAGYNATNAYSSVFIGDRAGYSTVNANNSIFIGVQTGYGDGVNNSTGGYSSIAIGDYASPGGFSNSIALGKSAVNTATNQFMVADTYTNWRIGGLEYFLPNTHVTGVLVNDGLGNLTWVGGYLTSISGLNISDLNNDLGYLTSYTEIDTLTDVVNRGNNAGASFGTNTGTIFGDSFTSNSVYVNLYEGSNLQGYIQFYLNNSNNSASIFDNSLLTRDRTWYLPNNNGTIALVSDIPDLSGYATEIYVNSQGFITSSDLSPYLLSSTAALTYFPIPTGTTSQYLKGDGSLATFPTIPTVGTWGVLNYPTWVSGTPFVKMTAAGTFALDTNTYLTTSSAALTYQPLDGDLTAIAALNTNGFAKRTGTNTWVIDTNTYLTSISGLNISSLTNDSGYITSSALSGYLTNSTAASTYLTISNPAYTGVLTTGTLSYIDTGILASFQSSVNSYNQFVLQNTNAGTAASTSFIVSNNNGSSTVNYGEFGINSSGFTGSGSLNLANAVYLTATTGDLVLGTTTPNSIRFLTNASTTDALLINTTGFTSIKGLVDNATWFVDNSDNTKRLNIDVTGTTGITGVLQSTFTTAKTITLPDTTGTIIASVTALPGAVTGIPSSSNFLRGDGTWATPAGGGTPGGSNTQLQYNNSSAFGGISRVTTDGSDISYVGATSGTIKLIATAIAGTNTLTLPAATDTLVGRNTIDTLTNKRIATRVLSATSYTTNMGTSLNCDNYDTYIITAQTTGTLTISNSSGSVVGGTPIDGQLMRMAITAASTVTLSFSTGTGGFEASGSLSLPTSASTTRIDIGFVWNSQTNRWRIIAYA